MKTIDIVTPTYNEEGNIELLISRILEVIEPLSSEYTFFITIIDNCSVDGTRQKIRCICDKNRNIRALFNSRNFGHLRSPYYGIISSQADATIYLASDLQDPPELIPKFISEWEKGFKIVMAVKPKVKSSFMMHIARTMYYRVLNFISEVKIIENSTGFGLYDQKVVEILQSISDPYPFLRGIVGEIGFKVSEVHFTQPKRNAGRSKNNYYSLYDIGIIGVIRMSKVPMRVAIILGFITSILSFFTSIYYLVLKISYWDSIELGVAPLLVGLFFVLSLILIFLGLIGEYLMSIQDYVRRRPIVIIEERLNFN